MSKRPIEMKQRRKVMKAFRQQLPAYRDLVDWLVSRGHAKTKREARQLIKDGRVRVGSHVLRQRRVPAKSLAEAIVLPPKDADDEGA